jgi:DNA mismatch repair protein MutS
MSDIYQDYVDLTRQYRAKYGPKTVVLLQVGAFFEVYGFVDAGSVYSDLTPLADYAQVCNLNIMDKKTSADKRLMFSGRDDLAIVGAGFRDYSLDRYLQKLVDAGYTAVTYVQEKDHAGKVSRKLDAVYSPGTYLSSSEDTMTNNICCLWIEMIFNRGTRKTRQPSALAAKLVFGVAMANMLTGTSSLCEWVQPYAVDPAACDKLERIITVHNPSEFIIVSNVGDAALKDILQFSGCCSSQHHVDLETSTAAKRATEQKYIRHILTDMYGSSALDVCQEFTDYPTATQAYCFLIDFIQEHNPNLVKNIGLPQFQHTERMLLANHTLRQLNIHELETLLNLCVTAMGKRAFHEQLTHPTTDLAWLDQEYQWTNQVLLDAPGIDGTRQKLREMRDVEKMARLLVLRKLQPAAMVQLQRTLSLTVSVLSQDVVEGKLEAYFSEVDLADLRVRIDLLLDFCRQTFCLDEAAAVYICPGVSDALDRHVEAYEANQRKFHEWHKQLNLLMQKAGDTTEYVKIHETEKSGLFLQITKKRALVLKQRIMAGWTLKSSGSSTNDEVTSPELVQVTSQMQSQKEVLHTLQHEVFLDILATMEAQFYDTLTKVAQFIAKIDVLKCKAHIARQFKYCRPTLSFTASKSFVQAKQLRHPLIERLQQHNTTYVANDIHLGCLEQDGILLYGTNAVGKTSLIRAVGMAVIMAQAGLYVPCTTFVYRPYTAIFSRILANDNLFKGLSTFVVEMSELRVILNMADANSLVLGDELCSGTESESALAIFVAGLVHLRDQKSSFIFATHFHEMAKLEEVQSMDTLRLKHMAVHYDRERDGLVYDRLLRDGPGDRMYGLEVCKALHLPKDFLEHCYQLRTKYFPTARGALQHAASAYNAKKIRGRCELCKVEMSTETHHVVPQHLADADGYVTTDHGVFHKNHAANLQSVCEACHLKEHQKKLF